MSLLRGAGEDLALQDWLSKKIFPLEAKLTDKMVYYGALLSLIEMMKSGTTSIYDINSFVSGQFSNIFSSTSSSNLYPV
jgi:5-methylthioadenosine/S-adenosylhomocysteine deaminase